LTGYIPSLGTVSNQDILSAALVYDNPSIGKVISLVLPQVIHIPTLMHNLVCPIPQMRMNDMILDECSKFLAEDKPLV
jgi:hypothetical protein